VLGSGLGPLAEEIEDATIVPYAEIPYFPVSTAPGHHGSLIAGRLGHVPVLGMAGRAHLYEGYRVDQVVLPIRTIARLGVCAAIVTNCAPMKHAMSYPPILLCRNSRQDICARLLMCVIG